MSTQDLIATYTYTGDIITLLIGVSLFVVINTSLYYSNSTSFTLFKRALFFTIAGALSNIGFAWAVSQMPENIILIIVFRGIYHTTLLCALMIFILYVRNMVVLKPTTYKVVSTITNTVFLIGLVADLLSPVFHYSFYYSDGLWIDSTFAKPFTIVYIYGLVILGYLMLFNETKMIRQLRMVLSLTFILVVSILLTESLQDSNSYTSITFILPLLVVFVMVHTNPYDMTTGALGLEAMGSYLEHMSKQKTKTTYVILELKIDVRQKLPQEIGKAIHTVWYKSFKDTALFNIQKGLFILAIRENDLDAVRVKINNIIENNFSSFYNKYHIPFKIVTLYDGYFISTAEAMVGAVDFFLSRMDYNTIHAADEKEMAKLKKSYAILNELVEIKNAGDLNDDRILAYCQPVKNTQTGKFDSAEVLMRMNLPDIGFVFPDEFIPLAERYNYIHTLSMIILNKACVGVKKLMQEGYDFNRVSVNFAVSELHDQFFCDEVMEIISSNDIPYEKIAIELTESQNDSDFQMVFEKIKTLRSKGIRFYLDDFGTGYSNFERIIRLKLDIIKFDRSLLLCGESDETVSYTLKHFSEAFHELGFKVLFEGLETETQEVLCEECKADYLQGYKYSKPIPFDEYRGFLTKVEQ